MVNKKSKFLFYIVCLLLLSAELFFGLRVPAQSAHADSFEASAVGINSQIGATADDEIFRDYTRTSLREGYDDKAVLERLRDSGEISSKQYERAVDVLEGRAKFTSRREFSTEFKGDNQIEQVGDIAKYSQEKLNCIWKSSELILTGIYGMPGYTFDIFVEASGTAENLPTVLFTQNHGYYTHWYERRQLKIGWNQLVFPTFGLKLVDEKEIIGGAVYLCNPYFPEDQGEVNVYVEGGDYYPVFRKGGNEKEFLNFLEEYENERKSKNLLDMADLVTDHAIISTTSSSLADVYLNRDVIAPSENLELWGNYFTELFEFNGIPASADSELGIPYDPRNDYVRINFRYMSYYPGSGAYSYSYHIGWYYEHYWFANFYNAKNPIKDHGQSEHLLFGIGHELGHALDNEPRKINETTNNFTAAMAYFNIVGMPHHDQYQPFDKTVKALSNDYTLDYTAYDDGQIMYTKRDYPTNYDHNYLIWWDLEAVFPGFWAKFNDYFRKPLKEGLTTTELYVYYSSLATGVDLSDYYERWGFYYGKKSDLNGRFVSEKASDAFKTAMKEATDDGLISRQYDHFWYVDGAQSGFMAAHEDVPREEREYENKPVIAKISLSGNERTLILNGVKDEYHLGYEILSKVDDGEWKLVGFTYTSSFTDKTRYSSAPTYKAIAINRFFKASPESDPKFDVTAESPYVCRVGEDYYGDLAEAISRAESGATVYLLDNCKVDSKYIVRDVTLQIDDGVHNDVYIYYAGSASSMFIVQANFSMIGKDDARIVIDGGNATVGNPAVYGTSNKITIKNVSFRNFNTKFLAGAIFSTASDLEICNSTFEFCNSAKNDAAISSYRKVRLENCGFSGNFSDVYVADPSNLTLANQQCGMKLSFDGFDGEKSVAAEGNASETARLLELANEGYTAVAEDNRVVIKPLSFKLKFRYDGSSFEYTTSESSFVFGDEGRDYGVSGERYVEYEEVASGERYRVGEKIYLGGDAEFDVEVKDKLVLKIFYQGAQSSEYFPQGEEIYLPTADENGNKVVAYGDGDGIYNAGEIYVVERESFLAAIYRGNLTYRFFVDGEIYDVGYGVYGQTIDLPELDGEGFLGWQTDEGLVSDVAVLKGETDFVALFKDRLPEIYDLSQCEIRVEGDNVYSGREIMPKITVFFNGIIVPSGFYSVSYSDNVSASEEAQVVVSAVPGLSTGSKTKNFTIAPKRLGKDDVKTTGITDFVYDGNQTTQDLAFSYDGMEIETFTADYIGDRTNAGKVRIKILLYGNFLGEFYLEYTIFRAERENFSVSLDDWVYGENGSDPQVGNVYEEAAIFYSYSTAKDGDFIPDKPTAAGDYFIKASIEETQNYKSAEATATFKIERADFPEIMPDGEMTVPRKAETLRAVRLIEGWSWENPETRIVGESMKARAVYNDRANYKNYSVEILLTKEAPKDVGELSVELEGGRFTYDGTEKTPKVVAKDGETTLRSGVDYDVKYENNRFAGRGRVEVSFKNDYTGRKEFEFTIFKAEKPQTNATIRFAGKANKLSDIPLPNGFVWKNGDEEITAGTTAATAVYTGEDADNYETTELVFEIILDIQEPEQTPEQDKAPDREQIPDRDRFPEQDPEYEQEEPSEISKPDDRILPAVIISVAVALAGAGVLTAVIIRRKRR